MSLKETIREDLKNAMKAQEAETKSTISMLLSSIKNRELEKRGKLAKEGTDEAALDEKSSLTDEEVIEVVSSEIKKRKESIATYEDAGRTESAESEKKEVQVLSRYLPEQLSDDEVKELIAQAISQTGASALGDMGKVMGAVSGKTKGRFDGKRLSEMVKEALGQSPTGEALNG